VDGDRARTFREKQRGAEEFFECVPQQPARETGAAIGKLSRFAGDRNKDEWLEIVFAAKLSY
jgi:hypothetical protein